MYKVDNEENPKDQYDANSRVDKSELIQGSYMRISIWI